MSKSEFNGAKNDIDLIFSPHTIRTKSREIYEQALQGKTNFKVNLDKLDQVAQLVKDVTLKNYPTLNIPFHSRWNHFQVGNVNRMIEFNELAQNLSLFEKVKSKLGLVIVSVLLDAGAGMRWRYKEDKKEYARSEGLAVASFRMFMSGLFSKDPKNLLRVDAEKLLSLTINELGKSFQVTENNTLVGLEGRLNLLHNLGQALTSNAKFFGEEGGLGNILEYFLELGSCQDNKISAPQILRALQDCLGAIWPGRLKINGINMGDVWQYQPFGDDLSSLIPFHKLSQWLSYSMFEPLMEAGLFITNIHELTGLAEYRNGGLIIDSELIELKNPNLKNEIHAPDSELIIEWRSLTVILLDEIAKKVTEMLAKKSHEFPLARVLEGGTWWAGRQLAQKLRDDGGPPLKIKSDGTVF